MSTTLAFICFFIKGLEEIVIVLRMYVEVEVVKMSTLPLIISKLQAQIDQWYHQEE